MKEKTHLKIKLDSFRSRLDKHVRVKEQRATIKLIEDQMDLLLLVLKEELSNEKLEDVSRKLISAWDSM